MFLIAIANLSADVKFTDSTVMVLKVWACGPFPRALFQKHGRIDAAIYTKNSPITSNFAKFVEN